MIQMGLRNVPRGTRRLEATGVGAWSPETMTRSQEEAGRGSSMAWVRELPLGASER